MVCLTRSSLVVRQEGGIAFTIPILGLLFALGRLGSFFGFSGEMNGWMKLVFGVCWGDTFVRIVDILKVFTYYVPYLLVCLTCY